MGGALRGGGAAQQTETSQINTIQPAEEDLRIDCNKPTREEIKRAIGHIQNGKAAGPDGIPAEALKGDVTTSVEMLYSLFEEIWEEEEIPAE